MLATWPDEVARPIEQEIHNVLHLYEHGDVVTLGARVR